jgi:hypothetical protein
MQGVGPFGPRHFRWTSRLRRYRREGARALAECTDPVGGVPTCSQRAAVRRGKANSRWVPPSNDHAEASCVVRRVLETLQPRVTDVGRAFGHGPLGTPLAYDLLDSQCGARKLDFRKPTLGVPVPLDAWTCDSCGDLITDPERGLVTWRHDADGKYYDFILVHKNIDGFNCDPGHRNGYSQSVSIDHYLGDTGQAALMAFLSVGPMKNDGHPRVEVKDFDGFVDLFRRLQTPWYEESRSRFDDEDVQLALGDANEYLPYMPEVLERIANRTL